MSLNPIHYYDVASPNCYIAHKLITGIEKRTGEKFTYIPVLLGGIFKLTDNSAPFIQFQNVKGKNEYYRLEMLRFLRDHQLSNFQMNPNFPVNTVMTQRGAIVAEMEGFLMKYADATLKAMWEDGLKMDDPEVFHKALADAGLDANHIIARIQDQDVKDKLLANTQAAVERGIFGCPTFFVGDEMFFGKDRLDGVEQEIERQKSA